MGDEYVYVNPFCKNKNGSGSTEQTSLTKLAKESLLSLDGICNVQLYLDDASGRSYVYPIMSESNPFLSISNYEAFQQSHYPPPKA
jgi:hypothetical protein